MRPEPVLLRSPLAERPEIHQIVLPTPWDVGIETRYRANRGLEHRLI